MKINYTVLIKTRNKDNQLFEQVDPFKNLSCELVYINPNRK